MYKYAFIYRADDIYSLKNELEKYLIKNNDEAYILSQEIEVKRNTNIIYIDKFNTSEVRIYKNENIFMVLANRIKDIKEYNFLSKYSVIDLTDNKFVNNIFESNFSNNMTKISLKSRENLEYDDFTLMGNRLFKVDIFDDMKIFENNSEWSIDEYVFQPVMSKYCIKIKKPNRIEFNKRIDEINFEEIIKKIICEIRKGRFYEQ